MIRPHREEFCKWCACKKARRQMFKVRDGPVEWYFCDVPCAEDWLEYRHEPKTYHLCRLLPSEKLARLSGRSMRDEIFRLMGK